MKKRWIKLLLLGAAAYLVFVITQVPANLAYRTLDSLLAGKNVPLKMYGVDGTVWSGRADRLDIANQSYRDVLWQLQPSALLLGRAQANFSIRNNDTQASATVARTLLGDLIVKDVRAKMDAQAIITMLRLPAIKLGGEFNLNLDILRLKGVQPTDAKGIVVWNRAQSQFPQTLDLGDLSAKVDDIDNGVKAVLSDSGAGPLELAGELVVLHDGNYTFKATLAAREGMNSELGRALMMMGRVNGQGKIEMNNAGNTSQFAFLMK